MRNLTILGGSSHPELTARITQNLSIDAGEVALSKFSNGETSVMIKDSVREKDVYVIQSGCGHVNDHFVELLIMISACKTASARKVTAVLPLFPYSRQPDLPYARSGAPNSPHSSGMASVTSTPRYERTGLFTNVPGTPSGLVPTPGQNSALSSGLSNGLLKNNSGYRQWVAQAGTLIASLLTCAGADHIITMDLHDPQFQGFFDIPVDNLYGKPILQHYITNHIPEFQDAVIVSPDAGGAKRATAIADSLGMAFALIHKERRSSRLSGSGSAVERRGNSTILVGDVKDKVALIVDDLVDTGNTITRAARLVKDHGAVKIYAIITHSLFSGDAVERIKASAIDKIVTTNSTPQDAHQRVLGDRLEVLDVGKIFAEAIRRIHNGESVSMLFDHLT